MRLVIVAYSENRTGGTDLCGKEPYEELIRCNKAFIGGHDINTCSTEFT